MSEDLLDDVWVFDGSDDLDLTLALLTNRDVDVEDPLQQPGP